jgi:hypothetical protein
MRAFEKAPRSIQRSPNVGDPGHVRPVAAAARVAACEQVPFARESAEARGLGIQQRTFTNKRKRIWDLVKREFDALPDPRGRGGRG